MLMTYRPTVDRLAPAGETLLNLIREAGESGISRPQLSAAVGKKRLNLWDDAQLAYMETAGLITVSQRPSAKAAHILEYVYRATIKE